MISKEEIAAIIKDVTFFEITVQQYDDQITYESMELVDILELLEKRANIKIPVTDINDENFNSVNKIAAYIGTRKEQADNEV